MITNGETSTDPDDSTVSKKMDALARIGRHRGRSLICAIGHELVSNRLWNRLLSGARCVNLSRMAREPIHATVDGRTDRSEVHSSHVRWPQRRLVVRGDWILLLI